MLKKGDSQRPSANVEKRNASEKLLPLWLPLSNISFS